MGKSPTECSGGTNLGISLLSGVIAGVSAAIISHPADTLLSKVNKKGAGGDGPMMQRLGIIAGEIGFYKLCTVGLIPRCVMIGTLTAGQCKYICSCSLVLFMFVQSPESFANQILFTLFITVGIFDTVMGALGASKFHFHNPNA
jgi:solute carrier family 25 phosphate transporter 3